jgi:N-acetylneuraminic acid mutarotase
MDYRIDHRREAMIASLNAGDLPSLLAHGQLFCEIKSNDYAGSQSVLMFNPTYKYNPRSNMTAPRNTFRPRGVIIS